MKPIRTIAAAALAASILGGAPATAAPIIVGFEDVPTNAPALFTTSGPLSFLLLSDTSFPIGFGTPCPGNPNPCNGDSDLNPVGDPNGVEGKVLIIQELFSSLPDDSALGGNIFVTFLGGANMIEFSGFSAVDDGIFTVFFDDTQLGQIVNTGEGEANRTTFTPVTLNPFDTLRFNFSGSGGIDSLVFEIPETDTDVPAPAALSLLGVGLGLAGFARRKHRRA